MLQEDDKPAQHSALFVAAIQVHANKDKNTSMYNVKNRRKIVPEKFSYI